jgi:uncharacterized protein YegP (UPF0339 family)
MPAAFILRKATNGQFHFNLTAANNKIILSSETYRNKASAQVGIRSVKANCADGHYERRTSAKRQPYRSSIAANGSRAGEMYYQVGDGARHRSVAWGTAASGTKLGRRAGQPTDLRQGEPPMLGAPRWPHHRPWLSPSILRI